MHLTYFRFFFLSVMPQSSPNNYEYQTKSPGRSGAMFTNAICKSAILLTIIKNFDFQLGLNSGPLKG